MYLTYDEAAQLLGIKRASVKQLVSRGILQAFPVPGGDMRARCLLRAQVEERKVYDRSPRFSFRDRQVQKLMWQQEVLRRRLVSL